MHAFLDRKKPTSHSSHLLSPVSPLPHLLHCLWFTEHRFSSSPSSSTSSDTTLALIGCCTVAVPRALIFRFSLTQLWEANTTKVVSAAIPSRAEDFVVLERIFTPRQVDSRIIYRDKLDKWEIAAYLLFVCSRSGAVRVGFSLV
mmetsp:Transcript_28237/g.70556  ORF Transcript_28237/g.70556 Transcript_28237/m.70556 type:complete len:144 (+) Transcript_28237:1070-1501(+)